MRGLFRSQVCLKFCVSGKIRIAYQAHFSPAPAAWKTTVMNEIAREFVAMNPGDSRRASLLKHFEQLAEIRMSIRSNLSELIGQPINELSREMITVSEDDERGAQVLKEIESLREMLRVVNG